MRCPECGRGDMQEVQWEGRTFYGCSIFNCRTAMSPKKFAEFQKTGQYEKSNKRTYPYREKSLPVGEQWSPLIAGTSQQQAVWREFGRGRSIRINALAGTGKTTVLVQGANRIDERCRIIALSFAKRDQIALAQRMPPNTSAVTVHSLGNRAIGRGHGLQYTVNKNKVRDILSDIYARHLTDRKELASIYGTIRDASKLIGLCQTSLIPIPTDAILDDLSAAHGIEYSGQVSEMVLLYMKDFALSRKHNLQYGISFDDMLFIPLMEDLAVDQADAVMVDEGQDLSPARQELSLRVSDQMLIVGDSHQAIYKFAGADQDSLDRMTMRMNDPLTLELTVNWRCGIKHIELAKQLVPRLECHSGALNGTIEDLHDEQFYQYVKPGHLVLSRNNAAMIAPVYKLLRSGIAANIAGKDFGDDLIGIIDRLTVKTDVKLRDFYPKLIKYQERQIDQLAGRRNSDILVMNTRDKIDTILALCAGFDTTQQVVDRIDDLFTEEAHNPKIVRFSTIHKAKGSENHNIHILNSVELGTTKSKNPKDAEEEKNILYIALTRAHCVSKNTGNLYFIGGAPQILK